MRWLLLGIAASAVPRLAADFHPASLGVREVQEVIQAETKSAASIDECRVVFPGFIYCGYGVASSPEGGVQYESLDFWNGFECKRLRHDLGPVS